MCCEVSTKIARTGLLASALLLPAVAHGAAGVEARLEGKFAMSGVVTRAHHVRGEHRGEHVARVWTFSAECPVGTCEQVLLTRTRAGGAADRVMLRRIGVGVYRGRGRFFVPLRCGHRPVPHGGRVPFTITVRVLSTHPSEGRLLAGSISATYVNPRRANLTKCPGGIGHDRARYRGTLTEA
jgi:hypothetical protein